MATTYSAQLTFEYDDALTRNYTFTDVTTQALSALKGRVVAFNATLADSTQNAPYRETFVSDDGAPVKRISKAKYTSTEEQVIYRG